MPGEDDGALDDRLAEALSSVGSPVRLAILRQLRRPSTLGEIDVRLRSGPAEGRPLARQTIREHLDKLIQVGVVVPRQAERDRRPTVEYVLNHQTVYAVAEEFRALAALRPEDEPPGPTLRGALAANGGRVQEACLVLVKGIDEGRTFSLAPPASGRKQWVIGRSRGAQVPLDFDPYVSAEHAVVEWEGGHHWLLDLPDSVNGALLNFEPLAKGERRALATGDVVGVGRSLLVYRR